MTRMPLETEPANRPDRCERCRHWDRIGDSEHGYCKRYPPTNPPQSIPLKGDWCGEWQAINLAAPPRVEWNDFINRIRFAGVTGSGNLRIIRAFMDTKIKSWESLLGPNQGPKNWSYVGPVGLRTLLAVMKDCGVAPPDHWLV